MKKISQKHVSSGVYPQRPLQTRQNRRKLKLIKGSLRQPTDASQKRLEWWLSKTERRKPKKRGHKEPM